MSDFPHATFRIEMAPGKRLGPGKIRLLELVGKTGSISAAARAMEMSYRRAWLLVESINRSFSAPLVAGTVALMLSAKPALTPAEIRATLKSTARPFLVRPATATAPECHVPDDGDQLECYPHFADSTLKSANFRCC